MRDLLVQALILLGTIFVLLSSLGMLRFPDIYCRMHASTKASSFGMGCVLLAGMIHFATIDVISKLLAVFVFIFLTAPIGAHILSRAAYTRGLPQHQAKDGATVAPSKTPSGKN